MNETSLQPDVIVYYIDNDTGQVFAEINGRIYEMEIGDDVTENVCKQLETIRVYDPADVDYEEKPLRILDLEKDISDLEKGEYF